MADNALIETVRREREEAHLREGQLEAARHVLSITLDSSTMFTAACSCRMWAIENHKTSHSVDAEAARALVADRHGEHVLNMGGPSGTKVELGYSAGRCTPVKITEPHKGQVSFGIICGGRRSRSRCQVCQKNWSVAECDFPLEGKCRKCGGSGVKGGYNCHSCAGTGRLMCNRKLCGECRAHKEPDEDYCPDHRTQAGFPPLVRREPCQWMVKPRILNRKCLRESCQLVISADDHVLFFPRRRRAMCEGCGEEYLRVAQ